MGGINHQPCNKTNTGYLECSTRMSRSVSFAHARLEDANVVLEDLLLSELRGVASPHSLSEFLSFLMASRRSLEECDGHINALREELDRCGYTDLPTIHSTNLQSLGEEMAEAGLLEKDAWNDVTGLMKAGTFYSLLDLFGESVRGLIQFTNDLHDRAAENKESALKGDLNLVLEQNRPRNFKVEFARLYTAWGKFHRIFLASSMLSTELWYAYTLRGSLLDSGQQVQVA